MLTPRLAKGLLFAGIGVVAAALALGSLLTGPAAGSAAIAGFVIGALLIGVALVHYIMNPVRRTP